MSSLFLHIGQCGNQVGQAFWHEVEEWYGSRPVEQKSSHGREAHLPFSLLDGTLPCILIDTETKVVKSCCRSGILSKRVPPKFKLVEKSGRGNNWAYGYYGGTRDSGELCLKDSVQDCVRKLVERCDRFMGTVLLHSIAGGTGSGVVNCDLEFYQYT